MKRTRIERKTPLARTSWASKGGGTSVRPLKSAKRKGGEKQERDRDKLKYPKLNKHRRSATTDERHHMGRVAAQGCILCNFALGIRDTPSEVHHLKAGGGSLRASHFDTMPLCYEHHRGNTGIHMLGQERFAARYGITETALLSYFKEVMGWVGANDPALQAAARKTARPAEPDVFDHEPDWSAA